MEKNSKKLSDYVGKPDWTSGNSWGYFRNETSVTVEPHTDGWLVSRVYLEDSGENFYVCDSSADLIDVVSWLVS